MVGWPVTSEVAPVPHGFLYLSVELGDDSVLVGVNTGPEQSVPLLEKPAQVVVGTLVHRTGGGGVAHGRGAAYSVLL